MKKRTRDRHVRSVFLQKILLVVFLMFSFSLSYATTEDSTKLVNFTVKSESLNSALIKFKDLTGVQILFNEELLGDKACKDLNLKNVSVDVALGKILEGSGFVYSKVDGVYMVKRASEQKDAQAKPRVFTGEVVDVNGEPLPGVTVVVKGTTFGGATDMDGKFELSFTLEGEVTLVFSFVGMESQEIVVKDEKPLRVVLKESSVSLEEVVVTGVFERRAESFTGSATTVTRKELLKRGNQNLIQSLRNMANELNLVFVGSAYKNKGVQELLDAVVDYLPSPLDVEAVTGTDPDTGEEIQRHPSFDEPFSGLVFKIMTDPFVGKLTYVRVYSGRAESGSYVVNASNGQRERLGRILEMNAAERIDRDDAAAGDIVACVGFKNSTTGDTLCAEGKEIVLEKIEFAKPVIDVAIEPKTKAEQDKMAKTAHNKIFIAPPMQIDLEKFYTDLQTLKTAARHNDNDVVDILREMVPTYHPNRRVRADHTVVAATGNTAIFSKEEVNRKLQGDKPAAKED